jgi:hypothetical protein
MAYKGREPFKVYSYDITGLQWVFLIVAFVGCIADLLFMADAFWRIKVGEITLLTELFPAKMADGVSYYITSIIELVLAFLVCALAVAFMFKAGSAMTENHRSTSYFFVLIWILLGIALIGMRLYICLTHMDTDAEDAEDVQAIPLLSSLFKGWLPDDIKAFTKEMIMAVLLLILYVGTGISANISGRALGNVHYHTYRQTRADYEEHIEYVLDCAKSLVNTKKKIDMLLKQKASVEAAALDDRVKDFVLKKKKLLVLEAIVTPYREAGIIVDESIFPAGSIDWINEDSEQSTPD